MALEPGATSWTALFDVLRLYPDDDATAITADQLRAVVDQLINTGQQQPNDPQILVARLRSDRTPRQEADMVLRHPAMHLNPVHRSVRELNRRA